MDNLSKVADHIKRGKKITFFNGAGVSTSVGIPDFRSPETGLYANLAALDLPYSEAVFDIDYFREKPQAFYTLASQLYPGKFVPSKFHFFLRLVQDKKLLKRIYTQNIDTLERIAGIKDEYMVEAHGSFASNHCIDKDCGEEMSSEELRSQMKDGGIPICLKCKGYVKPDIVFFGEGLPARFFDCWDEDCDDVEIAIVAGTSLTVYPFASLPAEVGKSTVRVLANKELVGDFKKKRKSDVVILENCDTFADKLSTLLGWDRELRELIDRETEIFNKKQAKVETAKEEANKEDEEQKLESKEGKNVEERKVEENKITEPVSTKDKDSSDDLEILISKLEI